MKSLWLAAIVIPLFATPLLPSIPSSSPATNPQCGEASWTITNPKGGSPVFNGKAACTTVEFNGRLNSDMGPENAPLSLNIQYDLSGTSTAPAITLPSHFQA